MVERSAQVTRWSRGREACHKGERLDPGGHASRQGEGEERSPGQNLHGVTVEADGTRRLEAHLEWAAPDRGPAEALVPLARLLESGPTAAEAAQHDAPHEGARFNFAEPTDERDGASEEAQGVVGQQCLERRDELVVAYGHRGLRVAGGRR